MIMNAISNNNNQGSSSAFALHDSIIANSYQAVKVLLEQGADPNRSPQLLPIGTLSNSNNKAKRKFHSNLCRVFRTQPAGSISPLIAAVCNGYHCSTSCEQEAAIQIVRELLDAGADTQATCNDVAFCDIGCYPSVTMKIAKNAYQVALFLKRFPPLDAKEQQLQIMDDIAAMILGHRQQCENKMKDTTCSISSKDEATRTTTLAPQHVVNAWDSLLENATDDANADLVFVCPDGRVQAHMCVVAASTSYFATALAKPWKSNKKKRNANIYEWNTSHSAAATRTALRFMYAGTLDVSSHDAVSSLLPIASEYQWQDLMQVCESKLIQTVPQSPKLCKEALCLSKEYYLSKLRIACVNYVKQNAATVLTSLDFLELAHMNTELWQDLTNALLNNQIDTKKRKFLGDEKGDGQYELVHKPKERKILSCSQII